MGSGFGPAAPHPTAGVSAVGARMPLVAYNVNLGTDNLEIANQIARHVRSTVAIITSRPSA